MGAEGAGRACAPPPARTRWRAGLGALADAGVAVAGRSGQGGRGPALRLASPPPRGRRPDPKRLRRRRRRPAASPPPSRLPAASPLGSGQRSSVSSFAAATPRTNRNRRLVPRLPGAPSPAPALRNRGLHRPPRLRRAVRAAPLRPPCRPRAGGVTVVSAPLGDFSPGRRQGFPPPTGSGLRPPLSDRWRLPGRPALQP